MELIINAAVFAIAGFMVGLAVGIAIMAICIRRNECKDINKEV